MIVHLGREKGRKGSVYVFSASGWWMAPVCCSCRCKIWRVDRAMFLQEQQVVVGVFVVSGRVGG